MRRALLIVILGSYLFSTGTRAQGQATTTSFYPATDAAKDIDAALLAATKDGKNVLLDFGADWCPDCRVLGTLFEDASVAAFVDANFHVVRIDVGRRDKNGDLATTFGATSGDWIPAVVVLDPQRRPVAATDTTVRLTRKTSASELLGLLRQWAPKKMMTTVASLASFTQSGVHVDVTMQRDTAQQVWLAATFAPERADAHLYAKDLPAHGIDGLGRPTQLSVVSATGLKIVGDLVADRRVHEDVIEELHLSLPVYPNGPVTLRLPVIVSRGAQAELSLTYMACGGNGCLPPVSDKRLRVTLTGLTP